MGLGVPPPCSPKHIHTHTHPKTKSPYCGSKEGRHFLWFGIISPSAEPRGEDGFLVWGGLHHDGRVGVGVVLVDKGEGKWKTESHGFRGHRKLKTLAWRGIRESQLPESQGPLRGPQKSHLCLGAHLSPLDFLPSRLASCSSEALSVFCSGEGPPPPSICRPGHGFGAPRVYEGRFFLTPGPNTLLPRAHHKH